MHRLSHLIFTEGPLLTVTGRTFHIKDRLKELRGRWSNGAWQLPLTANTEETRKSLNAAAEEAYLAEKLVNQAQRAAAKSSAGIAATAAQDLKDAKSRGWTCCEKAYVMDVNRGHVGCHEHGFFVKGILRTGD